MSAATTHSTQRVFVVACCASRVSVTRSNWSCNMCVVTGMNLNGGPAVLAENLEGGLPLLRGGPAGSACGACFL